LSFDGTGDYVDCGNCGQPSSWSIVTSISPSAWGDTAIACSSIITGADAHGWGITCKDVGDLIRVWVSDGASGQIWAAASDWNSTGFPSNKSTFVTATVDGSTLSYYKNGAFVNSTAQTVSMGGTAYKLSIARMGEYNGWYANSIYDYVMIWNRALIDAEIALLYREPFFMIRRRRAVVFPEPVALGVVNMAGQADSVTSSTAGFLRLNRPGAAAADSVSSSSAGFIRLNRPLAGVAASASQSTAGFRRLNIPGAGQAASATTSYAGCTIGAWREELFRNRRVRHTSVYSRRLFKGVF